MVLWIWMVIWIIGEPGELKAIYLVLGTERVEGKETVVREKASAVWELDDELHRLSWEQYGSLCCSGKRMQVGE